MIAKLIILCLTAAVAYAAVGSCKTPKTQSNFDLEKFSGIWYEIETSGLVGQTPKKCSSWKFEFKGKNKATVLQKYYAKLLGKMKTDFSDVESEKKNELAKLSITPKKSSSIMDIKWTMNIVETDYENYAIGYSCVKKLITKREHVYIFSRSKKMDDDLRMKMYEKLSKNDLPQKTLVVVEQDDKDCD